MFKLIQSLFGTGSSGDYPESLINEAIERCVDGTDPWIRGVSGYRKKLRPAVVRAIDYVVRLVDELPEPAPMSLAEYSDDHLMKSFFISAADMRTVMASDTALGKFMREADANLPNSIYTLLTMEKQERGGFGAALSGDIVIHDVPQVTVSFDSYYFIDPCASLDEHRLLLKHRTFDHLVHLALKQLAWLKSERTDLERRRKLLQSKQNLLQRYGFGFVSAGTDEKPDASVIEKEMEEVESQLNELGGDDYVLDKYLETVSTLMGTPEKYLHGARETIYVDRMGIKKDGPTDGAAEVPLIMLYSAEGISIVALPVVIQLSELKGL